MTILQAIRQWSTDVPNIVISVTVAGVAWLAADYFALQPSWAETIWFGLCAAGVYYHWSGLRELYSDQHAVMSWIDHDNVDLETIDNSIRREKTRLTAKAVFTAAGFISMFIPPRIVEVYDTIQQILVILLIFGVLALDVDAVMDRRSRRRTLAMIRLNIQRRQERRAALERMFMPIFEAVANAASEQGRQLAHDINGRLSLVVGTMQVLQASPRLNDEEHALVASMDETMDEVCREVADLQELVRDLAIPTKEVQDDRGRGPAGSVHEADQP